MEMNIDQICRNLLDNSDVVIDLSDFPKVTLTFAVIGTVDSKFWEVVFVLNSVFALNINREHYERAGPNDSYMVLEAAVNKLDHDGQEAHSIYFGDGSDLDFSAKTVGFEWQATRFTKNEFKLKYNYMFADKNA
jgi:hypothetical protein